MWTIDLLPNELAPAIGGMMDEAVEGDEEDAGGGLMSAASPVHGGGPGGGESLSNGLSSFRSETLENYLWLTPSLPSPV